MSHAFVFAVASLLLSFSVNGQSLDFKGISVGDTLPEVKGKVDLTDCNGVSRAGVRQVCQLQYASAHTYAEAVIERVFFSFDEREKLAQIVVTFQQRDFDQVDAAARIRFGKPQATQLGKAQNAYGAQLANRVVTWRDPNVTVTLSERHETTNLSSISFASNVLVKLLDPASGAKKRAADM